MLIIRDDWLMDKKKKGKKILEGSRLAKSFPVKVCVSIRLVPPPTTPTMQVIDTRGVLMYMYCYTKVITHGYL